MSMITVNRKHESCSFIGNVILIPGLNIVPAELQEDPNFKEMVKCGRLEVVGTKVDVSGVPDLESLSPKKALDLVSATLDRDLLKKMEETEAAGKNRTSVLNAITAQIDKVTNKKAPEEGSEGDE